jgi:hypothetical protein
MCNRNCVVVALATFLAYGNVTYSQQENLGSSATLEWLQGARDRDLPLSTGVGKPATRDMQSMVGSWAQEPIPAFRYRFWPARTSLRPGSAQTHFYRAVIESNVATQLLTKDQLQQLNTVQSMDLETIPISDAQPWADRFELTYGELAAMAEAEDLDWDLRVRDLRGKDIWAFRLEEVQQARNLARMLNLKIATQIAKKDYAGAAKSIEIGFRLAALVGQSDSIIQSLVGLAIENMMYNAIEYAIRSPDCPSFYWALRTLPDSITGLEESIEVELSMVLRTLSVLDETEILGLSDREITHRLKQSLSDLKQLLGNGAGTGVGPTETLPLLLSVSGPESRRRLLANGYDPDLLEGMTDLQASLVHASRELAIQGDQLLKASKIRGAEGLKLGEKRSADFDAWLKENRTTTAGVVASLLFPAVKQLHEADLRSRMTRNRLLAIEALRLYGQQHAGRLPSSLEECVDTPAPQDPFSDRAFGYRVETTPSRQVVTLTSAVPARFDANKELKFNFPPAGQ